MEFSFLLFFLTNKESFFKLNSNILETNVINIFLLLGLLLYGYKTSFSLSLKNRQKEIIQTIENAEYDLLNVKNYYYSMEKAFFAQIFFLVQSWETFYKKDKLISITNKHQQVKKGLEENFLATETLILAFEKKAFLSLQKYILFLITSRILRKFLLLPNLEQSKFIETTFSKFQYRIREEVNKK